MEISEVESTACCAGLRSVEWGRVCGDGSLKRLRRSATQLFHSVIPRDVFCPSGCLAHGFVSAALIHVVCIKYHVYGGQSRCLWFSIALNRGKRTGRTAAYARK